ncbi:MAG: M23 family metallopeptidase [Vampirovibrionales bacterium]
MPLMFSSPSSRSTQPWRHPGPLRLGVHVVLWVGVLLSLGQALATLAPASQQLAVSMADSVNGLTTQVQQHVSGQVAIAQIPTGLTSTPITVLNNPTLLQAFADPNTVPDAVLKRPQTFGHPPAVQPPRWAFWHRPSRWERNSLSWPLRVMTLSSPFGRRFGTRHEGLDLTAPVGTPVLSAGAGKVVFADFEQGYGLVVTIDHGYGTTTRYAHLSRADVTVGDRVTPQQVIGAVGMTGRTTGPHLHFEVRKANVAHDPANYLADLS